VLVFKFGRRWWGMRWESLVMLMIYNVVIPYAIVHSTLGFPWDVAVGVSALVVSIRLWVRGNAFIEKVKRSAVYKMLVGG